MIGAAVVVRKVINAGREKVFEAFSNPDIMSRWFYPEEDMSSEVVNTFEVGGKYVIKMHAGNGDVYTHTGEYREIVPDRKLVFTWNSDFVQNTIVTVTFTDADGGTEVTVSHELLPEGDMAENHRKGWGGCLRRLSVYLKTGI